MSGPVEAPKGKFKRILGEPGADSTLAYYSSGEGVGALAPRGWHCFNVYGSDGAFLVVTPEAMDDKAIVATISSGFKGQAVIYNYTNGFTSGRDEIEPVVQHIFPAHMKLARNAAANNDQPPPHYVGPYPQDRLRYLSSEAVEFETPPHRDGIGTLQSHLRPDDEEIVGVHLLVRDRGDCCDLVSVAVRLPAADRKLASAIIRQVERDMLQKSPVHRSLR